MSLEGFSAGACAVHPTVPAVATCSRCGNFMCSSCQSLSRADLCDACERVVGSFPLRRESFDVMEALSYSWERYTAQWLLPTLGALVFFGITYSIAFVGGIAQVALNQTDPMLGTLAYGGSQVVSTVLNAVLMAVIMRCSVAALQGQTLTGDHVTQGLRRSPIFIGMQFGYLLLFAGLMAPFGALAGVGLLQGIDEGLLFGGIAVAFLVLMPILVYVMLGLGNAGIEAVIDPEVGLMDAFKRSWAVADGQRFTMILSGIMTTLLSILGLVACCVGVIPMWVLSMFLWAATYMGLRTGLLPTPTGSFES